MHEAHLDVHVASTDLEDLLEGSMDEVSLRETAESVQEECRQVIWEDDRFAVVDTRLGDADLWQRCACVHCMLCCQACPLPLSGFQSMEGPSLSCERTAAQLERHSDGHTLCAVVPVGSARSWCWCWCLCGCEYLLVGMHTLVEIQYAQGRPYTMPLQQNILIEQQQDVIIYNPFRGQPVPCFVPSSRS